MTEVPNIAAMDEVEFLSFLARLLPEQVEVHTTRRTVRVHMLHLDLVARTADEVT